MTTCGLWYGRAGGYKDHLRRKGVPELLTTVIRIESLITCVKWINLGYVFFSFAVYNETVLCLASKTLSTPGKFLGVGLLSIAPPLFLVPFIVSERFVGKG